MKHVHMHIHPLPAEDIARMVASFAALGWNKPASQYRRYLTEQEAGKREVLVARSEGMFSGYLAICWHSVYPPFRESDIPEIQDLNVLPDYRRQGIACALLNEAERRIAGRSTKAGIGVGMDPDYGGAQRLYVLRGYVPDGRGLWSHDHHVRYGEQVPVDDALVLYFVKTLALKNE